MYKISPRLSPELIFVAFIHGKANQSLLIREFANRDYNFITQIFSIVSFTA